MPEMNTIKIVIAEDNELFKTSLVIALEREEDIEITGFASNGKECLGLIDKALPDLVLVDIGMPVMNGLDLCKAIKEAYPSVKVMIFSTYTDKESVLDALRSKADAYCTKETSFEKLISVIHTVMEGAIWLDPMIASYVHSFITNPDKEVKEDFNLSERELEILALLAEGKSNKQIADQLFITINTSKAHVCNIMKKLSAQSRTDAAVKASKHGLI